MKKIQSIRDLQAIECRENQEPLVDLQEACPSILSEYRRKDAGIQKVLVRKSVADLLQQVQSQLTQYNQNMKLLVVEGYRSPVYQEGYFLKQLLLQKNAASDFEDLLENTHQLVALPSVAGHPTGGAIDLTIAFDGQEIDMGGEIANFSHPSLLPTYSKHISKEQQERRLLLHDLMTATHFAPFYGEWWHFSYGDREWAAFYDKPEAFYTPLSIRHRRPV